MIWSAADLVETDHAVVAVEGRVFYALGHDGRGELLKALDELGFKRAARAKQQHLGDEVEETGVDIGATLVGALDGVEDFVAVIVGDFVTIGNDIGSVDAEAGSCLADGAADLGACVVAAVAIVLADAEEEVGEAVYIAAESFLLDSELLVVRDGVEVGRFPGEVAVDVCELAQAIGMHEETVTDVEEVVAAGAFDGPVGAEEFAGLKDFFADDPGLRSMLAKTGEVLEWIAQAIGMIDTYAVEYALIEPLEDAAMGCVEDVRALNANADEGIDIEEATVAEFLIGGAPVGEPVVLLIEKVVEGVVVGVECGDDLIDRGRGFGMFIAEAVKEAEDDFFVAMADVACLRRR